MKLALTLCLVLLAVSGISYGTGTTCTWGGSAGNWTLGTNWSGGSVPATNDNVILTTGTPNIPTANSTTTMGALSVSGSAYFAIPSTGVSTFITQYDAGYPSTATGNFIWNSSHDFETYGAYAFSLIVDGSFLDKYYGTHDAGALVHASTWTQDKIVLRGGNGKANAYLCNSQRGGGDDGCYVLEVDGTYYDNGSAYSGLYNASNNSIAVGGTNAGTTLYYPLVVTSTGRIVPRPDGQPSIWTYTKHVFQGGQNNLPALGSNVDFGLTNSYLDNGLARNTMTVAGGVIYPRDLYLYGGSSSPASGVNEPYVWKVQKGTGSFAVGRDFIMEDGYTQVRWAHWFYSVENDATNTKVDFTVDRNFQVGTTETTADPSAIRARYGARFFGSNVRIGGSLLVGNAGSYSGLPTNNGAVQFDCSTVRIGKDFIVAGGGTDLPSVWTRANWSDGTATIIMDGNGTVRHNVYQRLATWGGSIFGNIGGSAGSPGLTIHNLRINNPGGIIYLDNLSTNKDAGGLRLSGDLEIDCGTFKGYGRAITFNGASHTLTNYVNPSGYQFDDNINVLCGSTLYLGSDITIKTGDNLNLGSAAGVYLNGHKLIADGKTYDGTLPQTWTNDLGTVFGAPVPEPATLMLLASGALGAIGYIRRQRVK